MSLRNITIALLMIIGSFLIAGCGPKRPDGIPAIYPAKVTVKNGASPIAGANVFLVYQGTASGSWSVNGVTDASGVAEITTSQGDWKSKGAPEGEYKIYITKRPDVQEDPMPEEIKNDSDAMERFAAEQQRKLAAAPKVIPDTLANPATSPLTISVSTSGTAELTVDISEHQ